MSSQQLESNDLPSVAGVAAAFHYTRTPTLLLDLSGSVVDLNAACRELVAVDVAGCRGQHYSVLMSRLGTKVDGPFPPASGTATVYFRSSSSDGPRTDPIVLQTQDMKVAVSRCVYESPRFGKIPLRITEVPRIDTETGTCVGSMICLEPHAAWDSTKFQVALDHRLSHDIMWEIYAASYDRVLSELPFYQEVVQRHCQAMNLPTIETILDVGAGTGIATMRLVDLGKQVTAIDLNRAMLRRLYAKLNAESRQRVCVMEDTAECLPQFLDASFDGVSVLLAFFDMNDPWSAIEESIRVLKPGGTLIITDPRSCFDVHQLMLAAEESLREKNLLNVLEEDWLRIQTVAPLIRDTIRDIQRPEHTIASKDVWHAEAILQKLNEEGFSQITFRESHLGNCATMSGQKPK